MKIDRLIAIIMILLNQDKITAKNLSKIFEVSLRTIYRDLETLNQAGIPITTLSGPGNGISILNSYKVEKKFFTTSDIINLLTALENFQNNLPNNEYTNTLVKIKSMIPTKEEKILNFKANQIKIDLSLWIGKNTDLDKIDFIKNALNNQYILKFEYRDTENKTTVREIEPYCLLLKGEFWYLQGYCLLRKDFRTFKILRMKKLYIIKSKFELRNFPAQDFKISHSKNEDLRIYKLKVHKDAVDKIISRFGEKCLTIFTEEYYIAKVYMPINGLAFNYLLSFGDKCECLEPLEVRKKLYHISLSINNMYKV